MECADAGTRQARLRLARSPNVHAHVNNGRDLGGFASESFDFVYSYAVFQHIPSRDVIENYVREVYALLRPGALFKFQVQGFRDDEVPVDSWLGAFFTEEQAREMAGRCGFEMRYNHGAGDQYYWLWFFKPPA